MAFDFRKLIRPGPLATIDPETERSGLMPIAADAPGRVNFQPGLGELPPEEYAPSWLDKALYAVSHAQGNRPSMHDAGRALKAEHVADLLAKAQSGRLADAGEGMDVMGLFALNQDPDGAAKNVNEQYKPREISPGASHSVAGGPMQIAPQMGVTPNGVGYTQGAGGMRETGRVSVPMTDAQRETAENAARLTAIQESLAPSVMARNGAAVTRARASVISASRPRGVGGNGGGTGFGPKPTGRSY